MAEVVELWHDQDLEAYKAEVRELCRLARVPDWAEGYIARQTPLADVYSDCVLIVFGRRLPDDRRRADA